MAMIVNRHELGDTAHAPIAPIGAVPYLAPMAWAPISSGICLRCLQRSADVRAKEIDAKATPLLHVMLNNKKEVVRRKHSASSMEVSWR